VALAGELGLRYAPVGGLTLAGRAGQQALLLLPARGRAPPGPLQSHLSTSIGDAWQRRRRGRRGQAPPGKGLICARARFERCAARPHLPAPFDAPPLRMAAPACASSRYGRESAHGRGLICIGTLQRARHALGSRSVPNQHSRPVARRSAGTSRVRGARHARRPAQARTGALHGRACCAAPLGVHAHNVVPAYRLRRHARLQLHDLLRSAATWTASHGTPRASTRPRVSRPSSKAPERGWPEGAALRPACLGQRCGFPQRRARTAPRKGRAGISHHSARRPGSVEKRRATQPTAAWGPV